MIPGPLSIEHAVLHADRRGPCPCPRPKVTARGVAYYSKRYKIALRELHYSICNSVKDWKIPLHAAEVPLSLDLEFFFIPPRKSLAGQVRIARPDTDNLVKSFLDAGQGILWADDAQVVFISARKKYGGWKELPKTTWRLWRGRMVA